MAFNKSEGRKFGGGGDSRERGEKRTFQKKRVCRFCADNELMIDYKNRGILYPFLTERAKLVPRRISGTCSAHQRQVTRAVKRARHLAIVPYSSVQVW